MLREQDRLIYRLAVCLDAAIVVVSFQAAYVLRDYPDSRYLHPFPILSECLPAVLLLIACWIIALQLSDIYRSMRSKRLSLIFWSVFEASLVATLAFSALGFLIRVDFLTRTFVMIHFAMASSLIMIEKGGALLYLRTIRKRGYNYRVLLIVGSGLRAQGFARTIESHPEWGLKILGFIDEKEMLGMTVGPGKVIGTFDDLSRIMDSNVVDEVVFVMPRKWLANLEEYVRICEKVGVRATIAVDFFDTAIARPVVRNVDGWPMLTFDSTPRDTFHLALKRVFDLFGSAFGLVALSPLLLLIALVIKLTSPGPVFFRQTRSGVHGRTFQILKFRTMVVDAEAKLKDLRRLNEVGGPVFKIHNDPRVTPIGRLLRKTSLDELPQLFNVLRGDMSLVGPRPPIPSEVEKYERWQRRRLSMRPGITCIHEVVARNNKDFYNWMKMDLEYIDNWHFGLDLKILIRTVLAVIRGTGC